MADNNSLDLLFNYASNYEFNEFNQLFSKLATELPGADFGEACLMRAQIKLYTADATIISDLEKFDRLAGSSRFPCLGSVWQSDAPNRFNVFPASAGALEDFWEILPLVRERMKQGLGEPGEIAGRQVQCEISYFRGEIRAALALAEEQRQADQKNSSVAILTQGMLFRCYLALGFSREAEECMLNMIRLSRAHPQCLASYRALRSWANLTTNWNGDSQRFREEPDGKRTPVLEDRLEGVRLGNAKTTLLEAPFLRYAELSYENPYTIRQYYMDLFHAMYWFQVDDLQQAGLYFLRLYQIAFASGLCMPFVECGEQVTPLLQYVRGSNIPCSRQWLDQVLRSAAEYEKSVQAYQDSGS